MRFNIDYLLTASIPCYCDSFSFFFNKHTNIMKILSKLMTATALSAIAVVSLSAAEMPSQKEMWNIIQAQQKQIEALKTLVESNQKEVSATKSEVAGARSEAATARAEATRARNELKQTQTQLEATTLAVEEGSAFGGWWEDTSVGGYGELHANFYEDADNQIDFHRFVLFFDHEYNDWITFYSELELEHALSGNGEPGEVELEQAFVRMDWPDRFSTDAGLFLLPVGILNETHEPNTFYGVERNYVEKRIIPTTWWEGGIKGNYRMGNGLSFDGAITSGLNRDDGKIRSGRKKVAKAPLEEPAFTGRVKYTGISGLEVAASILYQDDLAQTDDMIDYSGFLKEAHVDYSTGGFRVRALFAHWNFDGDISDEADTQYGFYLEPSYRFELSEKYGDLGFYARYSEYEHFDGTVLSENEIVEAGVNYWPTDNVVFKADIQDISDAEEFESKGDIAVNLGFGYQF